MRILQLCPTMHRAGTWFRCYYLSRAMARRGHEVTIVKVSPDSRLAIRSSEEEGIRLVETPRFWGARISHQNTRLVSDLLTRFFLVVRERYDVVHTYSHHFNAMLPGLAARYLVRRGALVVDWDDLWTDGGLYGERPTRGLVARINYDIDSWSERNITRFGDGVTVVSQDLLERSIAQGVRPDRILFLPNGAPVETIKPGQKKELRRALGLPLDRRILIFVGHGQYDIDLILDALALLTASATTPFTVFTGPHQQITQQAVNRRGLAEQVRVAGLVPFEDLGRYLAAADIGLLPYADKPLNRARWPIKAGDYLAAGLPIATCDVGEMGALIRRWNVGRASRPETEAYSEAIRLLLEDQDLESISVRARHAAEEISWDKLAIGLEAFYEMILANRRLGPDRPTRPRS